MSGVPADDVHLRPAGVSDEAVAAAGKASEALEWVTRARGRLYDFHQMMGRADLLFGEAVEALEEAGRPDLAAALGDDVVGRNVLEGRWTFQVVEEFDRMYHDAVVAAEARVRDELVGGRRHVFESELKEQRRTDGRRHHEARPGGPAEAVDDGRT
jgi:hypothetical protein